jgi:CRP-like cAMP-binding protein
VTIKSSSGRPNYSVSRFEQTSVLGNQLLAQLPSALRATLTPHLRSVELDRGQSLFQAHEPLRAVYFPETSVIALLTRLKDGEAVEVGLVGRDGLAGLALIPGVNAMPYEGIVQVPGTALRMPADVLKHAVRQPGSLRDLFGRYAYTLFAFGVQTAACNALHSVKERCARWLLLTRDLVDGDEFPITHSVLATMLGVRRPSVTTIANSFQQAHLIDYHHGRMKIRDRRGLETASCDCYWLIREEQRRLLGY